MNPLQFRLLEAWRGGRDDLCVVGDARQAVYSWNGADHRYLTEFARRCDALRHRPHATHFSVEEALEIAERIGPRRTILTHMAHEVDHDDPLPPGVELGYDGLAFEIDDAH